MSEVERIKVVQRHGILGGGPWFASWLFATGFLHLGFWRAVAALVIWPYYIWVRVSGLVQQLRPDEFLRSHSAVIFIT